MVTNLIKPSYKSEFARNASESIRPHLWRGKVLHYEPALGPTGDTMFDLAPYRVHGDMTAFNLANAWVVDQRGYGIVHADGSDFIDTGVERIGGTGLFADENESFTVALWFYQPTGGVSGTLIGRAGGTSATRTFQIYTSGATDLIVRLRGDTTQLGAVVLDVWHHVVIVWDKVEPGWANVDGLLASAAVNISPEAEETGQRIIIGARTNGTAFHFNGTIGSVRIWDRALTPNEARELYDYPMGDLGLDRRIFKAPVVVGGANPKGPLGHPLMGVFGGPI